MRCTCGPRGRSVASTFPSSFAARISSRERQRQVDSICSLPLVCFQRSASSDRFRTLGLASSHLLSPANEPSDGPRSLPRWQLAKLAAFLPKDGSSRRTPDLDVFMHRRYHQGCRVLLLYLSHGPSDAALPSSRRRNPLPSAVHVTTSSHPTCCTMHPSLHTRWSSLLKTSSPRLQHAKPPIYLGRTASQNRAATRLLRWLRIKRVTAIYGRPS